MLQGFVLSFYVFLLKAKAGKHNSLPRKYSLAVTVWQSLFESETIPAYVKTLPVFVFFVRSIESQVTTYVEASLHTLT